MARAERAVAESRVPLSRDRVLRAAVAVAQAGGITALTMRSLAQELGVKPMAVYHYVAGKEEVLDGIVDLVFAEIDLPPEDLDWRAAVRQRAVAARQVLRRHPWALGLLESRKTPGPATLRQHDAMIGAFRRGGMSMALTAHAYSLLDSYVYGFALTEAGMVFDSPEQVPELAAEMLAQFPVDDYPHLAAFVGEHIMVPGYDFAAEFEAGLDLILDGLEQRLQAEG